MLHLPDRPVALSAIPAGLRLRVVSVAAAGFPSPAQDWEDDTLSLVDILRIDRAATFVFRISGNSMAEAGIDDGDLVIVDRDGRARNGSLVIAVVEGGFVCRQMCIKGGVPFLEARNSRMTYPVTIADEDVEIWSVVRAGVRDFQR